MSLFRKIDWLAFLSTFAVVWTIYFLTLAPELTLQDSGELVTGSFYAGILHPPGYPVWTPAQEMSLWSHLTASLSLTAGIETDESRRWRWGTLGLSCPGVVPQAGMKRAFGPEWPTGLASTEGAEISHTETTSLLFAYSAYFVVPLLPQGRVGQALALLLQNQIEDEHEDDDEEDLKGPAHPAERWDK